MAKKKSAVSRVVDQAAVYTLTDLEQVKLVSDPLRLRILEAFCREPRTTKQVASLLGEKPTRLYHHVDALSSAGLIRLTDTRQVRGTVEKYYRSVARAFRADPRIFEPGGGGEEERRAVADMGTTVLERTAAELRELVLTDRGGTPEEDGIVGHVEVWGSDAEVRAVRDRLAALVQDVTDKDCTRVTKRRAGTRRFRLTIAYFPLVERPKPKRG
jgi:DNA-binding transcriptional ArsR family regulator